MKTHLYDPRVFDVDGIQDAKEIILTTEDGLPTEERWVRETPYVDGMAADLLGVGATSLVLDYGCGIGRVAKALIEKTSCRVTGADISSGMRRLAVDYVGSDHFAVLAPPDLPAASFDAAMTIWVLQHCPNPIEDVQRIAAALKPGSRLFIVNNIPRLRELTILEKFSKPGNLGEPQDLIRFHT